MKNTILDRIFELRGDNTYYSFSKKSGIAPQIVRNYFQKKAIPNAENIVKICRAYGVSSDWLLGLSDEKHILDTQNIGNNSPNSTFLNTNCSITANQENEELKAALTAERAKTEKLLSIIEKLSRR